MAFPLKRNEALSKALAVLLDRRIMSGDGAASDLRLAVFDNSLAVDDVRDLLVAQHDCFSDDPLVSIERIGCGVDAVPGLELSVVHDVRTGRAHVPGCTRHPIAETAKELKLDRDRKVLPGRHRPGIL